MGLLIKLKNGDTSLKSLKFGNDRPEGGDSGQPYIKNPIEGTSSPINKDFLLRGGINAPLDAAEDVARLTKYFFDFKNPNGLLFIAKQNLLSRAAVKTEASFGPAYGGFLKGINLTTGNISFTNGFFNEGIYTPLSTIAEAGVVAFGGHLNKQGLDPTGKFPLFSLRKYQDVAFDNNKQERNSEDPRVPLSLVRRSQNASDRAGRKIVKATRQELKTKSELAVNVSLPNTGFNEFGSDKNSFAQSAINKFLQKWDAFRDKQAIKKLNRKDEAASRALDRQDELFRQVQNAENAPKTYANKLLNLWNLSGLNPSNPFNSISPVLYSYSGGPNSILGIGNTDIKFATTNDGVTALRTNDLRIEDLNTTVKKPSFQTTTIFGNMYSPNPGVSIIYQDRFKISPFLTNPDAIFYTGDPDSDYLENYFGKPDIQPWIQNFITPSTSSKDPKTYLVGQQRQPETGVFTIPVGATYKYSDYTGELIETNLLYGVNSLQIESITNIYDSGTLEPRTDIDLSEYLTRTDPGVNAITRNEPLANYDSPINPILTKNNRELITDPIYNPEIGTFTAIDPKGEYLGEYDSSETLYADPDASKEINETKKFDTLNKGHKGYQHNPLRPETGRGIAVDFRKVKRKVRGFSDKYNAWDYISEASEYNTSTAIDSRIYYNSAEPKRSSKKLLADSKDLINFNIGIVDPEDPGESKTVLDFRAYIDQFSDSYSNDWAAQTYMGRAEKQYRYNSFERNISLGFTIVADNQNNLEEMYSQLNVLASSIAPKYTSQGYMAGVFHKLTVGNYVTRQPGILQGLTFEITDETPWQIDAGSQLPLYIKVTGIKFVPIHTFRPQVVLNSKPIPNATYNVPVLINQQYEKYIYQPNS